MNVGLNVAAAVLILASTAMAQEQPDRAAPPTVGTSSNTQQSARKPAKPHSAELKWKASTSSDIEGYYVYRAEGGLGAGFERITSAPVKKTEYKDVNVHPGKTYVYAISAVKTVGSRVIESSLTPSVVVHIPNP